MRTSGAVGQRLCCGLVAALVLMTAGNEVLHADDAELRDCTPDDLKEWRWKRGAQVGVHVIDPHRNLIPTAVATDLCAESVDFALDQDGRASDGIHGWVLAAGCKQATCGWPASFEHNTAMSRFTAEHDLNHNIIPEASHLTSILGQRSCFPHQWTGAQSKWATTSVRRNAPAYDDPYLCFPPNSTIHVEITPPQGLRSHLRNYWMDESDRLAWRRRLAYGQYCAYGPFVADTGHGAKAEIHPAERFWWNENTARVEVKEGGPFDPAAPDGPFVLYVVQDASSRYVRGDDFVLKQPVPVDGTWRPWAKAPIQGSFEIPFGVTTSNPVDFHIESLVDGSSDRPMRVPPARVSDEDGFRTLATVSNEVPGLGVEVQLQCHNTSGDGPEYLGRLLLSGRVGRDREWEEGFLAFKVSDSRAARTFGSIAIQRVRKCDKEHPTAMVTWKLAPGTRYSPLLEEDPGDQARLKEAITLMFKAAGWPDGVPIPYPVLLRAEAVDLTAHASLSCLTERQEKGAKTKVNWDPTAEICYVLGDEACRQVPVTTLSNGSARVAITDVRATAPPPSVGVQMFNVGFGVTITVPDLKPASGSFSSILWSHAFRAELDEWEEAGSHLCDHISKQEAVPSSADDFRAFQKDWLPPAQEVRLTVRNLAQDDVITMTELSSLVSEAKRLCPPSAANMPQYVPTERANPKRSR